MSPPGVPARRSTSATRPRGPPGTGSAGRPGTRRRCRWSCRARRRCAGSRRPSSPPPQSAACGSDCGRRVDEVLLDHVLDARERPLLGHAGDVARAGQRHLRHRGRLDGQRGEVLGLERVDVGLAARARQHLHLERERVQEVVDPLRRLLDDEPLAQLGILRRDADRAAAGVAVVALPGRHAHGALVVGDARDLLVAVQRHQGGVPDRDRLGAERDRLRDVAAVADAAGHDEVDLVGQADVLERAPGLRDRRHQRDAGLLGGDVRAGAGAALGAVQVDDVRARTWPPCGRRRRRATAPSLSWIGTW